MLLSCILTMIVIVFCRMKASARNNILCTKSIVGIAFPTCVSVNNCICNFSPLRSDPPVKLKTEDVVKM